MAAYYGSSAGRVSLNGGSRLSNLVLPQGACDYKDLAAGDKAPTCGCKRFWLNGGTPPDQNGERAWCFCGHHACFHEQLTVPAGPAGDTVQVLESVPPNVFPSSHHANTPSQAGGFPTWSQLIGDHVSSGAENAATANSLSATGLGIRNSQLQSTENRLWQAMNDFARGQGNGGVSGDTPRLPSTAVPSLYDEPARVQQHRPMGPPVTIPPENNDHQPEHYSATEVATPSLRGTPDLAPSAFSPAHRHAAQATSNPAQAPTATQPTPPLTVNVGPSLSIQEICNSIQDFTRRLHVLENMSFSHMPSEDIQEKFEFQDGRVLDLEQWRIEQDKMQADDDTRERLSQVESRLQDLEYRRSQRSRSSQEADSLDHLASSSRTRRLLPTETSSLASDGSFDENAAAHTEAVVLATLAANAETGPRIDALESRIADLESATLPSFTRPWHVQVVLLPFGRQLPGIWFSASESTQHSVHSATQASEEWIDSQAASRSSFRSVSSNGAWTTESIEAWANETQDEWLSPKACGPNGTVFQRLASRGLVCDVVLNAPDARHICNQISHALNPTLKSNGLAPPTQKIEYHGLQERFIPLRKVRKSSRLRFLSPSEMITPATWTADFLESSVFMKINDGERRLYLTTPEGYTQAPHLGLTWADLKHLPTYDVDGEIQKAQRDGNVVEGCWTYHDRLDRTDSLHSSFASRDEEVSWSISSEDQLQQNQELEDILMQSPTKHRAHVRSASFPSAASVNAAEVETLPKRRVASFELEPKGNTAEYQLEYNKRRRISGSPELDRRGNYFTPRWSREPPSPFTAEDGAPVRASQSTGNTRQRATTPFAYATPHSHLDSRGGDGDTEVDEIDVALMQQSDNGEDAEEWEGVQDQEGSISERLHHHRVEVRGETDISARESVHEIDLEDDNDGPSLYKIS